MSAIDGGDGGGGRLKKHFTEEEQSSSAANLDAFCRFTVTVNGLPSGELVEDGREKKPNKNSAKPKQLVLQLASQNQLICDSWVEAIQAVIVAKNADPAAA